MSYVIDLLHLCLTIHPGSPNNVNIYFHAAGLKVLLIMPYLPSPVIPNLDLRYIYWKKNLFQKSVFLGFKKQLHCASWEKRKQHCPLPPKSVCDQWLCPWSGAVKMPEYDFMPYRQAWYLLVRKMGTCPIKVLPEVRSFLW